MNFPILKRKIYNKKLIYLDNAATTQKPKQVIDKVSNYYKKQNSNTHSGIHKLSEESTYEFEKTRELVAEFMNVKPKQIVFTSGTTHSINILARGIEHLIKKGDEIIITRMEHHSNFIPWQQLCKRTGAKLIISELNEKPESKITKKTKLIAITQVSNVLGTIVNINKLARITKQKNILLAVDGAQAIAHLKKKERNFKDIDFYSFSAHKIYGPTGVGILYGKDLSILEPSIYGGGMIDEVYDNKSTWATIPHRFEAGTQNIAGVIGFGETIKFLNSLNLDKLIDNEYQITKDAYTEMKKIKGLTIYGPKKRGPVISFTMKGIHPHDISALLDTEGIASRAGHHCCMPLMTILNLQATARVSFAMYNTKEEIKVLIKALKKIKELFK